MPPVQIENKLRHGLSTALSDRDMPGLNLLRALAISLVILYHVGVVFFHAYAVFSGGLGVTAFFVLSGFLITSILLREFGKTGDISFRNFYKRRAFRIFPAFYVAWTVTILVMIWQHRTIHAWEAASSFFYLADYGRAFVPYARQSVFPMGVSWSLAVEEQFYFLWPLLLLYMLRTAKNVQRTLGIIIVGLWVYRAVLMLGFGVSWLYAYNAFDTRVDAILTGCYLAVMLRQNEAPKFMLWCLRSKWLMLIPISLLVGFNYEDLSQFHNAAAHLLVFTIQPLVVMILLVQLIYHGHSSRWMRGRIVTSAARISYSLYLFQTVVLMLDPRIPIVGRKLTAILVMIIIASTSYLLIEKPFMKLRDRETVHASA